MNTICTPNQILPHNDVNSELQDDPFVWLVQYMCNIKLELKGPTLEKVVTILAELFESERGDMYRYRFRIILSWVINKISLDHRLF